MLLSSLADDFIWCHEGAFLSSWWQRRALAGSHPRGKQVLARGHPSPRLEAWCCAWLCISMSTVGCRGRWDAPIAQALAGPEHGKQLLPPSPFMFTQCFTPISPAHIYLPDRVRRQGPGSLQGFCKGSILLSWERGKRQRAELILQHNSQLLVVGVKFAKCRVVYCLPV